MSNITLRPDYKAGDTEFEADVEMLKEGFYIVFSEKDATDAVLKIGLHYAAAQRQATYWRHQAESMPTPEQIFADEAWCKSAGYVKV